MTKTFGKLKIDFFALLLLFCTIISFLCWGFLDHYCYRHNGLIAQPLAYIVMNVVHSVSPVL